MFITCLSYSSNYQEISHWFWVQKTTFHHNDHHHFSSELESNHEALFIIKTITDFFLSRLGLIDNEIIINPTRKDLETSSLNLVVAATKANLVVMMEGNAQDILQQDLLKAIKIGTNVSEILFELQKLVTSLANGWIRSQMQTYSR